MGTSRFDKTRNYLSCLCCVYRGVALLQLSEHILAEIILVTVIMQLLKNGN
jgi:hypothetical protein